MEAEGLHRFRFNDSLADITLTKSSLPDGAAFKGHKVVLAAASDLFYDLFTKENQEFVDEFKIPAFIETKNAATEDPYNKAFSYMYTDQTFEKIKDELSPNNVFQLYSVAYTLKIKKLIRDLEELIVNELLDSENCINFYLDGIRFSSKRVTDACEKLLVKDFQEICTSKDGHYFLSQLPLEYFQNLMKDNELFVDNENKVLECVEKYIRHRVGIEPDKTAEEKKAARAALEAAGEEVPPDPEEEEKAKKEEEFNGLDDKGKIQWTYNEEVNKMRKVASERMRVRGLRPEEKRNLFKTIRYAYLTHQELLKCSRDPLFNEAKEFLVEGLTYKIEPEEVIDKEDTLINLDQRQHYIYDNYEEDPLQGRAPQHHRVDATGAAHQENPTSTRDVRGREHQQKTKHDPLNHSPRRTSPRHHQTKKGIEPLPRQGRGGHHAQTHFGQNRARNVGANINQLSYPPRTLHGMDDTFARADTQYDYPQPPVKFGAPVTGKSKQIGPQVNWATQQVPRTAFDYNFDMDENGCFYFLGTNGGTKIWQNPHTIGQVQAFASSIGFGNVSDLVGRRCVNLRTLNEPFSFFGVDLGEGRKLLPSCYTIMNRNSSTHCLMNWHFEGSNDKLNWTILDRRVYLPSQLDNPDPNAQVDEEIVEAICQKQATNTWGVDQNVYNDIDDEGFRFFRIIQISPNSSGSDNLAMSCFELYGKIVSGRFP